MKQEYIVVAAVAAVGLVASPEARPGGLPVELKEESMVIEYTASSGEATIVVSAEAETHLARIEVRGPTGPPVLEMRTDHGLEQGFQGFVVETGEGTPEELMAAFPPGDYTLRARTVDGRTAFGSARFSHVLPQAPLIAYPSEGMAVPTTGLEVSWVADPGVVAYRVNLEQHESDVMTVVVTGGTGSFRVPDGVLAPGTRSQLEIGAIGADGNCTIVEVPFRTQ